MAKQAPDCSGFVIVINVEFQTNPVSWKLFTYRALAILRGKHFGVLLGIYPVPPEILISLPFPEKLRPFGLESPAVCGRIFDGL